MAQGSKVLKSLTAVLIGFIPGPGTVQAQSPSIEILSAVGGTLGDTTIHGDYAYLRESFKLAIIDLTTPGDLEPEIYLTLPEEPGHIGFNGTRAYVSIGSHGIQVVDITDPANATLLETLSLPSGDDLMTENGLIAYNLGAYDLSVYDISDPQDPIFLKSVHATITAGGGTLFLDQDKALIGDTTGFRIMDLSDPANPVAQPAYGVGLGVGHYAFINNTVFYYLAYPKGLYFVDVTDPASPMAIGSYSDYSQTYKVLDYQPPYIVFSAGTYSSIRVLDITTPASPVIVGTYPPAQSPVSKSSSGDPFFSGPYLFDIVNPATPSLIGTYPRFRLGSVRSVLVQHPLAFLTDGNTGYTTLDVANPTHPADIANATLPYTGFDVDYKPPYLYAVYGRTFNSDAGGLQVFEVSNPEAPVRLGQVPFPYYTTDVVVSGTVALAAVTVTGLRILDVSDPNNPNIVYTSPFSPGLTILPTDMEIVGNLAYLACGTKLLILDISNPSSPTEVANLPLGKAKGLNYYKGWVFIADGDENLHLVDVSNPASPALVQTVRTLGLPNDVCVDNNNVYVASRFGVEIYSFIDGVIAGPVASLKTFLNYAEDVDVAFGRAYFALGNAGFLIVSLFQHSDLWVDFNHSGDEMGTFDFPYNSLAEGAIAVAPAGTINIKGGNTSEAPRIDKRMRLEAVGGNVRIGVPGGKTNEENPQTDHVPIEMEILTPSLSDRLDAPDLLRLLEEMRAEKSEKRTLLQLSPYWMREVSP